MRLLHRPLLAAAVMFTVALAVDLHAADEGPDLDQKPNQKSEQELLDAFYKEMEGLLDQPDQFTKAGSLVKMKLKDEFQANQRLLSKLLETKSADPDKVSSIEDEQKVLAQCYLEVDSRLKASDEQRGERLQRQIRERFGAMQRQHPKLAANRDFQLKKNELISRISRQAGPPRFNGWPGTMRDAMQRLSIAAAPEPKVDAPLWTHPGEQKGPLQELRSVIQSLLTLKWVGQSLVIDRQRWDDAFAGQSISDIRSKVDRMLAQAGAPTIDRGNSNRRGFSNLAVREGPNVQRLFYELRSGDNRGGFSHGGSNDSFTMSVQNGLINARIHVSPTQFEFSIEESAKPMRALRVLEGEGDLEILLTGDMVHRIVQQAEDPQLMIVDIVGDELLVNQAESFSEFYRQYPQFTEQRCFALLDHLGIVHPPSRFDPRVVSRLLARLTLEQDPQQLDQLDRLVADLDSSQFAARDRAFAQLRDKLVDYYEPLQAKAQDPRLSIEVQANLRKLIDLKESEPIFYYDRIVSELALQDDRPYLTELRQKVDAEAQRIIDGRIASLSK